MELQEIVQRIINLNIAKTDEIAIIGRRENLEELPNFKYFDYKDVPLIKENAFKAVILKDPSGLKENNLNDVFKISKKYVLLADPSYLGAIQKTENFIECIGKGGFGQIYKKTDNLHKKEDAVNNKNSDYVKLISGEIKKLDTLPEVTILSKDGKIIDNLNVLAEKEKKDDSSNFLFNFALIQNLKKQIVEKEKIIVDKEKEIEILQKDLKNLREDIESLNRSFEDFQVRKETENKNLDERLKREFYDKKKREIRFFKELKKIEKEREKMIENYEIEKMHYEKVLKEKNCEIENIKKNFEIEMNKALENNEALSAEIDRRIENLKKEHERENKEIIVELGRQIKEKDDKLEETHSRYKNELNKMIAEREIFTKERKRTIVKFAKQLEQRDGIIESLEGKNEMLLIEMNKKIEELGEEHEKEKRGIIVNLGRQIKEKEDELEEAYSRYQDESNKKLAEMEKLEKKKNEQIEELRKKLETIRSAPVYRLLSKIKPLGLKIEDKESV